MAANLISLPDGSTITSGLLEGSPQDLEVTNHITSVIANATAVAQLDQQIMALKIKQAAGLATKDEIANIDKLQAKQIDVISALPDPTATNLTSPTGVEVAKSMLQANFVASLAPVQSAPIKTAPNPTVTKKTIKTMKLGGTQSAGTGTTLSQTPQPQINGNNGKTVFPTINYDDLYTYITSTGFLNPWGRNRQCDDDLKDLFAIVKLDLQNEQGEWVAIGKNVASALTE